jgi:hypothetical protein
VNYSGGSITKTAIVNGIPHYYSQGSYDTNGFTCASGEPSVGSATAAIPPDTCPDGQIFVRNSFGFICALDFTAAAAASSVPATSSHPAGSASPTQASVNTTSTTTNTSTGSTTTTTGTMTIPPITIDLPPDLAKTGDVNLTTAAVNALAAQQAAADAAAGAPVLPDQSALIAAQKASDTTAFNGVVSDAKIQKDADEITASPTNMGFSFSWVPPQSTCAPYSGTVHGYAVSWDLCPTIENIRAILAWLFALFGAYRVYMILFQPKA